MGIEQEMLNVNPYYHPLKIEEIGFVRDLTEKQWSKIVDTSKKGSVYNYVNKAHHDKNWGKIFTAKESGESLLKSLELTDENLILIKYT